MQQSGKNPANLQYYHGRIPREEAERRLRNKNLVEGMYLLRANMTVNGNYVLSIVHSGRIHHYSLECQANGSIMIQDGRPFPGPYELIEHHKHALDGLLTHPREPCNRDPGTSPMAWPYVTMRDFEVALNYEANRTYRKSLDKLWGKQRDDLVYSVSKKLHEHQRWFHKNIDREEAELRMKKNGHKNGKFLVRSKTHNGGGFALSLSCSGHTKHYRIDEREDGNYGIEEGPGFSFLMDLIGHYFNRMDGLLCKLTVPCVPPDFRAPSYNNGTSANPLYNPYAQRSVSSPWDEPESPDFPVQGQSNLPAEDHQKIYDFGFTENLLRISRNDLELTEELGKGYFGSVMRGRLSFNNSLIPVAVKTLIQNDVPNSQSEIMNEAILMARLKHKNVIRMIGICRTDTFMLVLELAPLGQLNKYVRRRQQRMPQQNLVEILRQVAVGMAYLGQQNFVHRDLAARNVLLVTETFAKISDFGMSKALGIGENYYKTERAGKWPLKWYAPECIWYFKFDTKSDVWSYGVTMWETFENGDKPYKGMRGQEILEFIDAGHRLKQPNRCPEKLYELMLRCWSHEAEDRPSFQEIVRFYKDYQRNSNP
ncbi:DgyrCDS4586 [Dimorphilus gyrociliatus]|uniref:Tyrosine-protein kinase n=1 Tax=Dimorphilus gyrociliatus TaxID=2664684 RepID=A0A7I8VHH2_9ANNE|nr:DgyrCDS4586 [Dimorphilus gyrociliatus]